MKRTFRADNRGRLGRAFVWPTNPIAEREFFYRFVEPRLAKEEPVHIVPRPVKPKAKVVAVHGYRRSAEMWVSSGTFSVLHAAGIHAIAHDLPNHGENFRGDGTERTLSQRISIFLFGYHGKKKWGKIYQFRDYVEAVVASIATVVLEKRDEDIPVFVCCYSLGGLALLRALQTYPEIRKHISGIVCISTPLQVDHLLENKLLKKTRKFWEPLTPLAEALIPTLAVDDRYRSLTRRVKIDRWIKTVCENTNVLLKWCSLKTINTDKKELRERLKHLYDFFGANKTIDESDKDFLQDPHSYLGPVHLRTAMRINNAIKQVLADLEKLKDIPICFIHGASDSVAPLSSLVSQFEEKKEKFPDLPWDIIIHEDGAHDLLFGDRERTNHEILDCTTRWIARAHNT